jgi:hypothetical protein
MVFQMQQEIENRIRARNLRSFSSLGRTSLTKWKSLLLTNLRSTRKWEELVEACIAVLAVFAWLAAMTLLP